ncbi:glycosyltransferase family 2 protein [Selenomonas ruminantium]|uniref:Glycosyltransferase involved in cell wall bisynthesis n=1 Tax=Selenomonas ruminantium TaxID=971 RepID=A0A1I0XW49_SELRU|nr:glycosyltransferase [Selenomonas ruminantium]SFB05222.1 Glycosyltransferase involved in cell wall bisynthesis [Selenomonas ruminantium]
MSEKLVSIVLPTYNGEENIEAAITSVLQQTYNNWELIIVNDCSTDNTLQLIQKFAGIDSRIKILNNTSNQKLPQTLNNGFAVAKGEYYTWTSDDNMYRPQAIKTLVKALEDNSEADMVYSNYTNIDTEGNVISQSKLGKPNELVCGNTIGASFLYKREIANIIGNYDTNLFLAEDYDYWLRIYTHGNIIHIDDDLYLYRRHAGSLSETKKDKINIQTYKALEKNFLLLYSRAKENKLENRFFDHITYRAGNEYDINIMKLLENISLKYKIYHQMIINKNKFKKTWLGKYLLSLKNRVKKECVNEYL